MPISCHFRDCKALLVTSLESCKRRYNKYPTFTFTISFTTYNWEHCDWAQVCLGWWSWMTTETANRTTGYPTWITGLLDIWHGLPDYWISDMDHRITGHLTWITGLLDIRHGSQDYWTFDLDYRTTGYPTWIRRPESSLRSPKCWIRTMAAGYTADFHLIATK